METRLTIEEAEEASKLCGSEYYCRIAKQLADTMRENERLRANNDLIFKKMKEALEKQVKSSARSFVIYDTNYLHQHRHSGLDTDYMTITSEEDINSLVKITFMGHGGGSGHKHSEVFFDPSCLPGEVNFRLKQEKQAKTPE